MHSRSLCYSLRSDEKSRSWHHGLVALHLIFASHDLGDGSLDSRSLCYSLRSDEKSRSWHLGLLEAQEAPQVSGPRGPTSQQG